MAVRELVCSHCETINRVPEDRDAAAAVCGRCKERLFSAAPADVSETAFAKHLRATRGVGLLVDVWASWCGPCRSMAPQFARAAGTLEPQVRLLKLNSDEAPQVMATYGISGIPALLLFHNGKLIANRSGALTAHQIVAWTHQALAQTT